MTMQLLQDLALGSNLLMACDQLRTKFLKCTSIVLLTLNPSNSCLRGNTNSSIHALQSDEKFVSATRLTLYTKTKQ